MPKKKKTPLTPQQYRTAQERTAWFREAVEESGLQMFQVAAAAGKHPQTLYRWMAIEHHKSHLRLPLYRVCE